MPTLEQLERPAPHNDGLRRKRSWIEQVAEDFRYGEFYGIWEYYGYCPKCDHLTSMVLGEPDFCSDAADRADFVGDRTPGLHPKRQIVDQLVVRCQCTEHTTDKQVGCGASGVLYGVVFEPKNDPDEMVLHPQSVGPASPAQLHAQDKAEKAEEDSLSTIQATAGKWQSTVTALIGLFALSGFIKGPDEFAKIDPGVASIIPWIALAIAVTGALAVYLSARAANGLPVRGASFSGAFVRGQKQAANAAASALQWAVVSAVAAYILLVAFVGLLWFGPQAPSNKPNSLVTTRTAVYCGPISPSSNGVTVSDGLSGGDVSVAASDIVTMQQVKTCPK